MRRAFAMTTIGASRDLFGALAMAGSNDRPDRTFDAARRASACLLSGVRRVQLPDRATEFNSVDDIRKALADANAAIAGASGTTPPSFTLATHSRIE